MGKRNLFRELILIFQGEGGGKKKRGEGTIVAGSGSWLTPLGCRGERGPGPWGQGKWLLVGKAPAKGWLLSGLIIRRREKKRGKKKKEDRLRADQQNFWEKRRNQNHPYYCQPGPKKGKKGGGPETDFYVRGKSPRKEPRSHSLHSPTLNGIEREEKKRGAESPENCGLRKKVGKKKRKKRKGRIVGD